MCHPLVIFIVLRTTISLLKVEFENTGMAYNDESDGRMIRARNDDVVQKKKGGVCDFRRG